MQRFYSKVAVEHGGCWRWTGAKCRGYGQFGVRLGPNKWAMRGAHRVSFELHKRVLRPGEVVRHTCDTPDCVNPDHLVAGTQAENLADMAARGRSTRHFNTPQAADVRLRLARGESQVSIAQHYGCSRTAVQTIAYA